MAALLHHFSPQPEGVIWTGADVVLPAEEGDRDGRTLAVVEGLGEEET